MTLIEQLLTNTTQEFAFNDIYPTQEPNNSLVDMSAIHHAQSYDSADNNTNNESFISNNNKQVAELQEPAGGTNQ